MSAVSPGPWKCSGSDITETSLREITDANGDLVARTSFRNGAADGPVLAAAPALLAALESYVRDVADNGLPPTQLAAWESACAAIKLARGG